MSSYKWVKNIQSKYRGNCLSFAGLCSMAIALRTPPCTATLGQTRAPTWFRHQGASSCTWRTETCSPWGRPTPSTGCLPTPGRTRGSLSASPSGTLTPPWTKVLFTYYLCWLNLSNPDSPVSPPVSPLLALEDWSYSDPPVLATSPVPTHNTLEPPVQAQRILLNTTRAMQQREKIEENRGRAVVTDMFEG